MTEQGEHRFVLELTPKICGKLDTAFACIRITNCSRTLSRWA